MWTTINSPPHPCCALVSWSTSRADRRTVGSGRSNACNSQALWRRGIYLGRWKRSESPEPSWSALFAVGTVAVNCGGSQPWGVACSVPALCICIAQGTKSGHPTAPLEP
jgi:hypothetical protein